MGQQFYIFLMLSFLLECSHLGRAREMVSQTLDQSLMGATSDNHSEDLTGGADASDYDGM